MFKIPEILGALYRPPTIHFVKEVHPYTVLAGTLTALGVDLQRTTHLADDTDLNAMASNDDIEAGFWDSWKFGVADLPISPQAKKLVIARIELAEGISQREKKLVRCFGPTMVYKEGTRPTSATRVAEVMGAKIVYLDKGFEPYETWLKDPHRERNPTYVQRGRERYWIKRVAENPPRGRCLGIVGANHLEPPTAESSAEDPARILIGRFPHLLEDRGVRVRTLEDVRQTVRSQSLLVYPPSPAYAGKS